MNVEKILDQMTLEEKVKLLCGKSSWRLNGVERLGVPEILVTDGPHGLRLSEGLDPSKTKPATALPVEAAMAATWNTDLVRQAAEMVGVECQHYGVSVLLGPGVNGKRSPLGGRNFEYYSEDPYLSGKMASAFISGIQSQGVGACLKHFAGNEQETRRFMINAVIDDRTFHEIYLAPFKLAIEDANPWTMMGAYNRVNGPFACESKRLLETILRDSYGYQGLIMSDWTAVSNKVETVRNGLDLEMPGPGTKDHEVIEAVQSGLLNEEIVNKHAKRVLNLINKAVENKKDVHVDWDKHHETAVKLAEESAVLLKNDGILPLEKGECIGVIGEFAQTPRFQGGGSSHMNPQRMESPLDVLKTFSEVKFAQGYERDNTSEKLTQQALEVARNSEKLVFFTGTTTKLESEGFDRPNIKIPNDHQTLLSKLAKINPNILVVLNCGSAIETRDFEDHARAILLAWLPGQGGAKALGRLLFGHVSPSGKLSETFPVRLEHNPSYCDFPGSKDQVVYSEGVFVGYRHYDTKKLPVQYPFGHGLSYTNFAYSDLKVDLENMVVCVTVKNTGRVDGKEVVQLYIHDVKSTGVRPENELKGFEKVALKSGQEKRLQIHIHKSAFSYYSDNLKTLATESGDFILRVGASSRDIRLEDRVYIEGDPDFTRKPGMEDTLTDWLTDDRTCDQAKKLLRVMGMDEYSTHYGILVGMPMTKVLWFYKEQGGAEDQVEALEEMLEKNQ